MKYTAVLAAILCMAFVFVLALRVDLVVSYDQTSVTTLVNITNSRPVITNISINYEADVNLSEGTTYEVLCNATIRDYNGVSDITAVNGTFHRQNVTKYGSEDNDTRYHNTTCFTNASIDSYNFWFACTFDVYYYAFNGTWECNISVTDSLPWTENGSANTTVLPLYAINVTDTIDYGSLSVGDTSATQEANITSFGNQEVNITVYGYGGDNETTGANLSFVCPLGDNISIGYERYAVLSGTAWADMINLSWNASLIPNLTLEKRQDPGDDVINTTYWALQVPPNPFGYCNGTVVFEAIAP